MQGLAPAAQTHRDTHTQTNKYTKTRAHKHTHTNTHTHTHTHTHSPTRHHHHWSILSLWRAGCESSGGHMPTGRHIEQVRQIASDRSNKRMSSCRASEHTALPYTLHCVYSRDTLLFITCDMSIILASIKYLQLGFIWQGGGGEISLTLG